MDILGIGPAEIVLIVIVALIFLGPKDLAKTGRSVGRFLRKVITSPEWRSMRTIGREISDLPTRLMREAGIEDLQNEIGSLDPRKPANTPEQKWTAMQNDYSAWINTPPDTGALSSNPLPDSTSGHHSAETSTKETNGAQPTADQPDPTPPKA